MFDDPSEAKTYYVKILRTLEVLSEQVVAVEADSAAHALEQVQGYEDGLFREIQPEEDVDSTAIDESYEIVFDPDQPLKGMEVGQCFPDFDAEARR